MKLLTISDTHNKHNQIPEKYLANIDGEISTIIHAGDVSSRGYKSEIVDFLNWYNDLNFANKILIAGNHDFYFEEGFPEDITNLLAEYPNITYLNDSGVEIDGVNIWGSPVQPWFYNWAFNRKGEEIINHWNMIPLDTHVLVTHGPVKGYVDKTARHESVGCPYLLEKISELKQLKLHIAGHIHEAYGITTSKEGVTYVNASVLNLNYEMQNPPIFFELNKDDL